MRAHWFYGAGAGVAALAIFYVVFPVQVETGEGGGAPRPEALSAESEAVETKVDGRSDSAESAESLLTAETEERFFELLDFSLRSDEDVALDALARLDVDRFDLFAIEQTLVRHFSQNYTVPSALDRLARLKEENVAIYLLVVVPLLENHVTIEDRSAVLDFMEDGGNAETVSLAAYGLGRSLASDEPLAALQRIETIVDPTTKDLVVDALLRKWGSDDPDGLADFLNEVDPSPVYDGAIADYLTRSKRENPAATMGWATALYDKGLRTRAIVEVATVWADSDPDRYEEWRAEFGDPDVTEALDAAVDRVLAQ